MQAATAFRHPGYRYFQAARFLSTVAFQVQGVVVGWQVYSITGKPVDLGYVGLAQFAPAIALTLIAGHVADRFDRRRVLFVCQAALALCSLGLLVVALSPHPNVGLIYALLVAIGTARAFAGPAGSALMPNTVPKEDFQNAVAWSSSIWQVGTIVGPAIGGIAYAVVGGASQVYGLVTVLGLLTLPLTLGIRTLARDPSEARPPRPSWRDVGAGLAFIRSRPLVLGAISLDLFAVLLGGAVALLPVFAKDILGAGEVGLGMLRSAPAVGAAVMAVLLALFPIQRRTGLVLFACVATFGLATVVFGLSRSFLLSLVALAVSGAADMVSVWVRHTLVQLETPDAMRGRVSAVNLVFIGASNELGEFESGLTAQFLGVVPAVVAGGVGTLLVVGVWSQLFPGLRKVDRLIQPDRG